MNKEEIEYIILLIIIIIIMLIYSIYIIISEKKKITYYKKTILYDSNYDKYNKMVKEMKKVIMRKNLLLLYLKLQVSIRRLFICQKH